MSDGLGTRVCKRGGWGVALAHGTKCGRASQLARSTRGRRMDHGWPTQATRTCLETGSLGERMPIPYKSSSICAAQEQMGAPTRHH